MQKETFKIKIVRYTIEPGKEVSIKMKPVMIDTTKFSLICEFCSYRDICMDFKDPTNPGNKDLHLCDFCQKLSLIERDRDEESESNSENLITYIPLPDAFEEAFPEIAKEFDCLLGSERRFKTKEIVDKVCPGWCSFYNEGHTNCGGSNQLCILRKLFNGNKK